MSELKTVTVTSCAPILKNGAPIQGTNARGPWMLHKILATDESGLPIQEEIVAFRAVPLGEQELKFDQKPDKGYGPSWSVEPVAGAKLPLASSPDSEAHEMLREQLRMLGDRTTALENAVKGLGGFSSTFTQTDVPVSAQAAVTTRLADDDEIPF